MSEKKEGVAAVPATDDDGLRQALEHHAGELAEKLQAGDMDAAEELVRRISDAREETLYRELGHLTRGLHDALCEFDLKLEPDSDAGVIDELPEMEDARSRLNYVIELTEEAANKTMDMVDYGMPIVRALGEEAQELQQQWSGYLGSGEVADDGSRAPVLENVSQVLDSTVRETGRLQEQLNEIVVAQGYQDLSGQVIKRVIALVNDVERSLVRLVRLASNAGAMAGMTEPDARGRKDRDPMGGHGPHTGKPTTDRVAGQDDVDDLLSSLGF